MICLLVNLSYKVTITCKWHQLVYFAIITANKPNQPPDFHCISPFVLATKLKMPIFRLKNNTKNYTYLSSIFNSKYLFKNKKSTSTANLKVRPCYLNGSFPHNVFRGLYISHFIRPSLVYLKLPLSRPKRILGNPARTTSLSISQLSSYPIPPTKYRIHLFYHSKLARIGLVGPGIHPQNGQRDNFFFTRGPPYLLHSMFGDSVGVKPPLTSVFFQRLASTHSPA